MPIYLLGTSHLNAPVALRERLAYSVGDLRSALESVRDRAPEDLLTAGELAILSTCNRTELYFAPARFQGEAASAASWELLVGFLADTRDLDPEVFRPHLYRQSGVDAVRHLCRVASGLESMVLGESEVLGQVGEARVAALEAGTMGPVLTAVFQAALRAGRRARAETGICRQPASVSTEAVALIRDVVGGLDDRSILVVGTGRMARRAAEALRDHGAGRLSVVSRTQAHAEALAKEVGATVAPWCDLEATVREADVVISSTSAPHPILTAALVEKALAGRDAERPLVVIDTAVPRDVEPAVRDLQGVRLFDLDDLHVRLRQNLDQRRKESPHAESIVEEEVEYFEQWRRGTNVRPLLTALRQQAEEIRRLELDRLIQRMPDLSEETRKQVEYLSHALVNKLLHQPTTRLRTEPDPGRRATFAQVAQHLFGVAGVASDQSAVRTGT